MFLGTFSWDGRLTLFNKKLQNLSIKLTWQVLYATIMALDKRLAPEDATQGYCYRISRSKLFQEIIAC